MSTLWQRWFDWKFVMMGFKLGVNININIYHKSMLKSNSIKVDSVLFHGVFMFFVFKIYSKIHCNCSLISNLFFTNKMWGDSFVMLSQWSLVMGTWVQWVLLRGWIGLTTVWFFLIDFKTLVIYLVDFGISSMDRV